MSFISKLRDSAERAQNSPSVDREVRRPSPQRWSSIIEHLRGRPAPNGTEWITVRDVFDALGLIQQSRPSHAKTIAAMMKAAGWAPTLVGPRHFRQRGYIRSPTPEVRGS